MRTLWFRIIFVVIILPSSIFAGLYYLNSKNFFAIEKIEVVLEQAPLEVEFMKPLLQRVDENLSELKGQALWEVKIAQIYENLQKESWIEKVSIIRNWPNQLKIRLKPYEVKLLYMNSKGDLRPVIRDGTLLSSVSVVRAPDAVILRGKIFEKNLELRNQAINMLEKLPVTGAFSQSTISEIRHDKKTGFWMSLAQKGIQVRLGENHLELKSSRVGQVIEYMDAHQFKGRVIDADFSKKVLVKLRNEP